VIYEIAREVGADLRKRGCPVPIEYGPVPYKPAIGASRIIAEHGRGRGVETWSEPKRHDRNPRPEGIRGVPMWFTVYASSTLAGARLSDHERLLADVLDQLWTSIRHVLGRRKQFFRLVAAGMPSATELAIEIEQWPGVVYDLRIAIDRHVDDANWKGEARPTVALDDLTLENTTSVKLPGQSGDGETACGGN
jgi:hypothetical protein